MKNNKLQSFFSPTQSRQTDRQTEDGQTLSLSLLNSLSRVLIATSQQDPLTLDPVSYGIGVVIMIATVVVPLGLMIYKNRSLMAKQRR